MLSSAHILAMDAKNLLDVIDSIRINYPGVEQVIRSSGVTGGGSPARTRSSVSTSSGSASASSSAASSLEKHREPGLGPTIHQSRASPLVLRPSIT